MTIRSAPNRLRRRWDGLPLRALVRRLVALIVAALLGTLLVVTLSLSSAVETLSEKSDQQSTQIVAQSAVIKSLQGQAADLGAQAGVIGEALNNALQVIGRRSPTVEFFVCWAAREGDLSAALPKLGRASPNQQRVFAQIAEATRTALLPKDQGGCLDPTLQIPVPPPVTIPAS